MYRKLAALVFLALCLTSLFGCTSQNSQNQTSTSNAASSSEAVDLPSAVSGNASESDVEPDDVEAGELPDLEVSFGRGGAQFIMHLYDNDTAAEIARLVGQTDWNLPIYNYDDFEGWEYMQYYDIPSRYNIPTSPETIISAKAGEVYYSDPNRIILFYQDAEINSEYSRIGYIEYSEEFQNAVESNPVVEGWGNKIVSISRVD